MTLYRKEYRVETTRLPYWDYAATALYFVTICTKGKEHTLGDIQDAVFIPTEAGKITDRYWKEIPKHYPYVTLDRFQVMPNHLHGILHISSDEATRNAGSSGDAHLRVSTDGGYEEYPARAFGPLQRNSLSLALNNFKGAVKAWCTTNNIEFSWQERFHEHIIRSEKAYHKICWYIENNVALWSGDSLNKQQTEKIQFPPHLM